MTRLVSSIYSQAHGDLPTPSEAETRNREAYKRAWHSLGLIILKPDSVLDDWTRQAFVNEANKQYGERQS